MTRLSSTLDDIKPHYDVVVIGSGYGGAISASRLARAGRSVCVLERGREIQPGEYPDALHEIVGESQVQLPFGPGGSSRLGARTGLFDVTIDEDINVLVGCGLGGTSLINANVSLRPDPRVFECSEFPKAVAADQALLDVCFGRAEEMLKPTAYPEDAPVLKKTQAQEVSAPAVGGKFWRLPINVNFEERVNHVGVHQPACTRCGDCVSGCNVGAKNTVLMNYLPDAHNHGAEIFCEASVDHLERRDGRWLVHFEPVGAGRKIFGAALLTVTADVVVLGAGTLGSVGILLRSKQKGLTLSDTLGQRFTGNGDMLGFAYKADRDIFGVGWGDKRAGDDVGPCITSAVDNRDTPSVTDGFIIQEGSIPGGLRSVVGPAMRAAAAFTGESSDIQTQEDKPSLWERLFGDGDEATTKRTQTYLVMAHDDGAGELYLTEDGRTRIRWPNVGEQGIFSRIHSALRTASEALRGTFVPNPVWTSLFNKDLITVHPLGGAHMGEDAATGVTDDRGRVFSGTTGTDIHPGLYVSDGALLPRPLGVNPLLTISAFAERNAHYIALERGWSIDYTLPRAGFTGPGALDTEGTIKAPTPQPVAVRFTETMKGFISTTELDSYEIASVEGEERDNRLEFVLTIGGPVDDMVEKPDHPARMVGTVEALALSDRPLLVTEGHFNLFITDADDPTTKRMWYRMRMQAVDGKHYYFEGFKEVHDDPGFDLWTDTSTLYITVWAGDDATGPKVARGILRILKTDFLRQLTTMQVLHAKGRLDRLKALTRFGQAFAGELWEIFGIG